MKKFVRIVKGLIIAAALGICLTGFLVTFTAPASVAAEIARETEPSVCESVSIICSRSAQTAGYNAG